MAVKYKLYQNTKEESPTFGKWYGRATHDSSVDIKQISRDIEEKCTLTESDVRAVIIELIKQMKKHLCAGEKVVLEDFGTFKVGIRTSPAESAKEFSAATNVKGLHVNFLPATTTGANKKRIITMIEGCQVREYGDYHVEKEDKPEP